MFFSLCSVGQKRPTTRARRRVIDMTKTRAMYRVLVVWMAVAIGLGALHGHRASAQSTAWVRTGGPSGGLGYDIKVRPDNPDIMFVTDALAGVHKSTDGGRT